LRRLSPDWLPFFFCPAFPFGYGGSNVTAYPIRLPSHSFNDRARKIPKGAIDIFGWLLANQAVCPSYIHQEEWPDFVRPRPSSGRVPRYIRRSICQHRFQATKHRQQNIE
jgi:hypothetical protein